MSYYNPIQILLDYANGKGFDIIDGGGACLDYINIHTFCKIVDNTEYIATKENNQKIIDICQNTKKEMKEVFDDLSKLSKSYSHHKDAQKEVEKIIGELPLIKLQYILKAKKGSDDARYLATNLYNIDKSALAFIGLHEKEKMLDQLKYSAEREGLTEVVELSNKLQNVFDDMYKIINGKIKFDDNVLLKKYSHNISKVIKPNEMIVTLDSALMDESVEKGYATKDFIGNKGANLVEMHKIGVKVPDSLFLTTVACKSIYEQQSISFMPLLKNILYMFKTDKIAIRSSGVISMAGMMDTVLDIDKNDVKAVTDAIMNVVNSWDSERAKSFRKVCKISDEIKVAIVIQPMVRGDEGCSGILFSRNPNNGKAELTGEYIEKSLGDKLASGNVTPNSIREFNGLKSSVLLELNETANKLEKHFKYVQDIEFVYDGSEVNFVQTRNAKLTPLAEIRTLIDFYNEGLIDINEFKKRYNPELHKKVTAFDVFGSQGHLISGTPAVNGVFTGKATFNRETANQENILIVDSTSPEDMPYLNKIGALVTKIGGMTSHPAVVCRQLNKPCIVGVSSFQFNIDFKKSENNHVKFNYNGQKEIFEGDIITIVGDTGDIYIGKCEVKSRQLFVDEVNQILNQVK